MRNALLIVFLMVSGLLVAQNETDTTYIKTYPKDLQVLPSVRYFRNNIIIKPNLRTSLNYQQNATAFGTRVQFDKWGIGLSVPTKLFSGKSNSSSFGVQIQAFPKSLMINAGAFRMKGFHQINLEDSIIEAFYPENQDMQLLHLYLNPIYVFSKNKFSLRSSLQLTERQLRSSGSFLAAMRVEYLRLKSNNDVIESSQLSNVLSDYFFRQNAIEVGYAYTQIIAKNYFISGMLMGGFANTRTGYVQDESKYHFKKWHFIAPTDLTFSVGYQSDRYFSSLQVNYRNRNIQSDGVQMETDGLSIQIVCGIRLAAPRLRRALDQRGEHFKELFACDR